MPSSATILITGDDSGLSRVAGRVGTTMAGMGSSIVVAAAAGAAGLVAIGKAAQFAIGEASEAAGGLAKLKAAIGDVAGADEAVASLQAIAGQIQLSTKYSDDYVISLYTMAAGMGVAVDALDETTNAALALSAATNGSLGVEQAMRSLVKATEADEIALKKFIPALGSATTEAERNAAIMGTLARGQRILAAESDSFAGRLSRVRNALGEAAEAVGAQLLPHLADFSDWIIGNVPAMQQWAQGMIDGFGVILEYLQPVFDGIATGWNYVRDAGLAAAATIVVVYENVGTTIEYAMSTVQLAVVATGLDIAHLFTDVLPAYLTWFGENWVQVFQTAYNFVTTVFENIGTNLYDFFAAVSSWMSGGEFNFEWTALTEGFENTMAALPEIAEREITDLEKSLAASLESSGKTLSDKIAARLNEWRGDGLGGPTMPDISNGLPGGVAIDTRSKAAKSGGGTKGGAADNGAGEFVGLEALWQRISSAASKPAEVKAAETTAASTEKTATTTKDLLDVNKSQEKLLGAAVASLGTIAAKDGIGVWG